LAAATDVPDALRRWFGGDVQLTVGAQDWPGYRLGTDRQLSAGDRRSRDRCQS